ncbi:hypothetical protein AGMMS49960_19450 [Betaproteobacteria bacterium]|nr:hypothetical protein AGMMS49960_19450 [Betaproteobacteria bacterium]GHU19452.1 hypothetical protein AGMMS50243_11490 [Betaproteobacteria bacterium]
MIAGLIEPGECGVKRTGVCGGGDGVGGSFAGDCGKLMPGARKNGVRQAESRKKQTLTPGTESGGQRQLEPGDKFCVRRLAGDGFAQGLRAASPIAA